MATPELWHIPLSHFSEKVRWALDYKGIAHQRRVLGPDYLIRAWRATGRGTLPILFLDGRALGDSTHIIAALEERHPDPPLYPADTEARRRALALEDELDEALGPALLSPLLQPPEIQYPLRVELPAYLKDYRANILEHPASQWAAGIYQRHRGRSAEVLPASSVT